MSGLADHGIRLRREQPGEHRTACPECARTKHRPRDDALAVKVEPDGGATWVCHRCGWRGALGGASDRGRRDDPHRRARREAARARDGADPEAEQRRELAQAIWRQAVPIAAGSPPWSYLRERRGIARWDPDRLLWHPACPWGRDAAAGCLVAPVNDHATGLVVGVWRIRVAPEGPVERRGLGPTRGNAARLLFAPGPALVVAEGVEDALAAAELTGLPAWAALGAGNMAALVLPERLREVLVLADRDPNGVGQAGAHRLAARLRAEGRHVEVRRPTSGKDPNDVLRAGRAVA
jgi:putative DNA primase/helicase